MYDKSAFYPVMILVGFVSAFLLFTFSSVLVGSWLFVGFPRQFDNAVDRTRQEATMQWMQQLTKAAMLHRIDHGRYVAHLGELAPRYIDWVPPTDAWGNVWEYRGGARITLMSLGADGERGPAPHRPWESAEPYEADLVMENGAFTQAPGVY